MPRNIQAAQSPTDVLRAKGEGFSPRSQECVHVLRQRIYPYFAVFSVVNHAPKYFDDRAVNVTGALPAQLFVLRSEQLNRIACQFQIFREASRESAGELARWKGECRDIHWRLAQLP